jgi:hypothetical protein
MTIYVTEFDANTKEVLADAVDSGFEDLDSVVMVMGEPLRRAKRTLTYRDCFYSDYCLHHKITPGQRLFFNRET